MQRQQPHLHNDPDALAGAVRSAHQVQHLRECGHPEAVEQKRLCPFNVQVSGAVITPNGSAAICRHGACLPRLPSAAIAKPDSIDKVTKSPPDQFVLYETLLPQLPAARLTAAGLA